MDLRDFVVNYDVEERFATAIIAKVLDVGIAICRNELSRKEFDSVSRLLGEIRNKTEVCIRKGATHKVDSDSDLTLHTDSPLINVIAWYCETPCTYKVPTLVLDMQDIANYLTQNQIATLSKISGSTTPKGEERFFPVLDFSGERVRLNYLDWKPIEYKSALELNALEALRAAIEAKSTSDTIQVFLDKGESLFINNRRVLHGRSRLRPDTSRKLIRYWIDSDRLLW